MVEFVASSGAKVVVNEAPWPDAKRLKMAVQSELAHANISLSLDEDIGSLISAFLKVDSADSVDKALWPCLARCTRDGLKVTEELFDTVPAARKDYYDIVTACAKANLFPLYESLYLKLKSKIKAKKATGENPA